MKRHTLASPLTSCCGWGRHHKVITASLKDVDISIRRRALDLLFTMCTRDSAADICHELLKYLEIADFSLRDELVLKLAILAERCVQQLSCSQQHACKVMAAGCSERTGALQVWTGSL